MNNLDKEILNVVKSIGDNAVSYQIAEQIKAGENVQIINNRLDGLVRANLLNRQRKVVRKQRTVVIYSITTKGLSQLALT